MAGLVQEMTKQLKGTLEGEVVAKAYQQMEKLVSTINEKKGTITLHSIAWKKKKKKKKNVRERGIQTKNKIFVSQVQWTTSPEFKKLKMSCLNLQKKYVHSNLCNFVFFNNTLRFLCSVFNYI